MKIHLLNGNSEKILLLRKGILSFARAMDIGKSLKAYITSKSEEPKKRSEVIDSHIEIMNKYQIQGEKLLGDDQ